MVSRYIAWSSRLPACQFVAELAWWQPQAERRAGNRAGGQLIAP
ncbi:MAG: hypothetical protein ACR2GA_04075 [Chloroflexota bacterium]